MSLIKNIFSGLATGFKAVTNFVEKNPVIASMAFGAVASAFSPDEGDLLEKRYQNELALKQAEWDREDKVRRRREANLNVGDIDMGFAAPSHARRFLTNTGQPVYPMDFIYPTANQGIINSAGRG